MAVVEYGGSGTRVVLDTAAGVVTLMHRWPSRHRGVWQVPVDEIVDVDYLDRRGTHRGWARIRTVTGQHPTDPADDPYGWATGGEHVTAFAVLIAYVAEYAKLAVQGRATRDAVMDEMGQLRGYLDEFRGLQDP